MLSVIIHVLEVLPEDTQKDPIGDTCSLCIPVFINVFQSDPMMSSKANCIIRLSECKARQDTTAHIKQVQSLGMLPQRTGRQAKHNNSKIRAVYSFLLHHRNKQRQTSN